MRGGTLGHAIMGCGFFIIGLWHLFNSIKLHSLHPTSYISLAWFPSQRFNYIEPFTIITLTITFICSEVFNRRILLAQNLRHLEHSLIALSFAVASFFCILLDRMRTRGQHELLHFLQAVAFGQQLLILHFHSTDHAGVEGQYHWLLEILTFVSMITSFLGVRCRRSFWNSFVRNVSVVLQGVWLIITGMLWTPGGMPEGCFLEKEMGRYAVVCRGEQALHRAKALVNLQFGFCLITVSIFCVGIYLIFDKVYANEEVEYRPLNKQKEEGDCEIPQNTKLVCPEIQYS